MSVELYHPRFLSTGESYDMVAMKRDGNTWEAEIPTDLVSSADGAIRISLADGRFLTAVGVGIDQNIPTEITLWRTDSLTGVDGSCGSTDCLLLTSACYREAESDFNSAFVVAPEKAYASWRDYIACETDSLLPNRIEMVLGPCTMPDNVKAQMINHFKREYFNGRILTYQADAKRFYNLDVENPPIEYYRQYLQTLDYSALALYTADASLYPFLYNLLHNLPLEIPPIAELPVGEWQADITPLLSQVIPSPTQPLLDLLAAASYLTQIRANTPLTPTQQSNIAAHFPSGFASFLTSQSAD